MRRVVMMIPTLFFVSAVSFALIQLPPGGPGTDQPMYAQYVSWIGGILLHGNFGVSFEWDQPVSTLLAQRLPFTLLIGASAMLFTWAISLPVGILSAAWKHSWVDYSATFLTYAAVGIPNFLLALTLGYIAFRYFHQDVGGLFSPQFENRPWDTGKALDLAGHLWLPVLVIAAQGIAGIVRILRANLLDELRRPYVTTARSKGMSEFRLLMKYPLRIALNPFISTIGWTLPAIINGEVIISQVMGLQTTGQLLFQALHADDVYLAGSIILIVGTLTVLGTLMSDILLAIVDPRVRLGPA